MYDIKWIREHPDAFDRGLKRRGLEPLSKKLLALDEKRRAAITKFEQAQARRNAASKEIGDAKKTKDEARANTLMAEVAELKIALIGALFFGSPIPRCITGSPRSRSSWASSFSLSVGDSAIELAR